MFNTWHRCILVKRFPTGHFKLGIALLESLAPSAIITNIFKILHT